LKSQPGSAKAKTNGGSLTKPILPRLIRQSLHKGAPRAQTKRF
jgi:hypothetical protein